MNECILEGKPDKGHPNAAFCPVCYDERRPAQSGTSRQSKITLAELVKKLKGDHQGCKGYTDDWCELCKSLDKFLKEAEENAVTFCEFHGSERENCGCSVINPDYLIKAIPIGKPKENDDAKN